MVLVDEELTVLHTADAQFVTMQVLHAAQVAFAGLETVKLAKSAAVQNWHVPVVSRTVHVVFRDGLQRHRPARLAPLLQESPVLTTLAKKLLLSLQSSRFEEVIGTHWFPPPCALMRQQGESSRSQKPQLHLTQDSEVLS